MPIAISEYTRPEDGFYSSRRKVFKRGGHFHVTILPAIPTKGYVCILFIPFSSLECTRTSDLLTCSLAVSLWTTSMMCLMHRMNQFEASWRRRERKKATPKTQTAPPLNPTRTPQNPTDDDHTIPYHTIPYHLLCIYVANKYKLSSN